MPITRLPHLPDYPFTRLPIYPITRLPDYPITRLPDSLQPVPLQPSVERAAAQAERLGRLADVAVEARHRLLDQEPFDFLEAHVFHARAGVAVDAQPELAAPNHRALR